MKAKISDNRKASSIYHDGKFYDTDKEFDLPFSEAFRLTRICNVDCQYENVKYDKNLWKDEKFINFYGDIDNSSGFGGCSYNLIKFTEKTLKTAHAGKSMGVKDRIIFDSQKRPLNQAGAMIWHDQPREQWLYTPFKKNIAIVPFETTIIPQSWIGKINQFDALFTLCEQNVQAFKDSGVTIPIELIHWGIDPAIFYPLERPQKDIFTFGTMGALSVRKGTDVLIQAFKEEFRTEKDVKLICKTSHNNYPFMDKDPRIELQMGEVSIDELREEFFKRIDCFVFPTRGEGFGLTPLESMATGVPAIVTGWSGPMEYMTPDIGWTIDYEMTPATVFTREVYREECGQWAEPSKEHLKQLMRYAYEHRDEVKEKGKTAAEHVKQNWTWDNIIKVYIEALNRHL